ncbi:MAG: hypothetical protein M1829_005370 [Trizodia sp. TS-e1964]|nr:MAG: hypothetical protein M1829_005370 [Trizodia sp. TS-e1964]
MAVSDFNILIDLVMVTLPCLGFLTIATSAVQIDGINIEEYDLVPKIEAQFKFNFTSMVEVSTAILCVNVPGIFAASNRFRRSITKGYFYGSGNARDSDGIVTIGGARTKRKPNAQDTEKTENGITLNQEFTVFDEESGNSFLH